MSLHSGGSQPHDQSPQPPEGWYAAPDGSQRKRYWSGASWTQLYQDNPTPGPPDEEEGDEDADTRDRVNVAVRKGFGLLVVLGIAIAVSIANGSIHNIPGPWQKYKANIASIETGIELDLMAQSEEAVTVDCPSSIEWDTGDSFNCIATVGPGNATDEKYRVVVDMENDEGEYTWHIEQ